MTAAGGRDWRLVVHDSLPSTSDVCRARAAGGEPERLAVLARQQTQGRGTSGRIWQSPPGNLYLSILLRPVEPVRTAAEWSLLAAVALADALTPLLPDPQVLGLKWPNDVLLRGAKLAGILTESTATPAGMLDTLIIGMGVNLAAAPDLPDRRTACLAAIAPPPAPEAFAPALLARLDHWVMRRATEGFAAVRAAWLARGPRTGSAIRLRNGERTLVGAFAGLGTDGSLLLATGAQVRAFAVGEVLATQAGDV